MAYIIKRKLLSGLGEADNADISALLQHTQGDAGGGGGGGGGGVGVGSSFLDILIVNHLVVKRTLKIPVGEDKFR